MSEFAGNPHWYALYTRSNFEKIVANELTARNVEAYLPAVEEVHRWKDRRKQVQVPVFPGYVFVRIADTPQNRLQVLRTTGSVRILGQGYAIEPVPEIEIDSVRRLLASGRPFAAHPFVRQGAWVRVKRGPLEGVEGFLERIKGGCRVVLSVQMLSQSAATEVDFSDIEVVRPFRG
jgi:transcription antitermination factor NusG